MTIAVIDIGTNTVLLLIAEIEGPGKLTTLAYEQRVPRLGKGVDDRTTLGQDSMHRVIEALREYKSITSRHRLDRIVVAGTSAVRDARNAEELADLIKREVGFDLEVLTGEDEAYWTYRGAISGVDRIEQATVLDIGGGSTEISIGNVHRVSATKSINVGSVRLTERFFKHDPPTPHELDEATNWVNGELANVNLDGFARSTLIGVAGTATSLAILDQGLREFSIHAIMNYRLELDRVNALFNSLHSMPSSEILKLSTVMEGRNDVMTAGTLILKEVMTLYGFKELIVSERGVRYGLAIREWERQGRPA
jgi:exopolyphosphatase/guanosine-5'-triphosphate,3'-diphosphate pyrophosphatase